MQVVAALLLLVGALGLLARFVRSYLHLASIPGPFLARFSDLWRFRAQNSPGYSAKLVQLHQKYGYLVRIGPNHISISDPDAVPVVYSTKPVWVKASSYNAAAPVSQGRAVPSIIAMSEIQHSAVRRSVGSAFTTNSLLDYEASIEASGKDLLTCLAEQPTTDISQQLQLFAIDVLMRMAFSESLGFMQKGGDVEGLLAAIIARFDHWGHWAAMPGPDYFFFKAPWTSLFRKQADSPLARVSLAKLKARPASKSVLDLEKKDLLQKFLDGQAKHPDLLPQDSVLGIIMSTIGAGADTTAGTLTYTFYLLCKHPVARDSLEKELEQAVDNGIMSNPPLWHDVHRLPYLDAVLKESMRLFPIAAWGLDRVVPPGGATIAGKYIPAGTVVGCQIDAVHLDKEVYGHDAAKFRPERWLEASEEQRRRMDRAFIAFSAGKRICMGIHIAWLELKKVVPLIMLHFRMDLLNPDQALEDEIRVSAVKYPPPIWMRLHKK
ncbi:hypothetical protein A1O3_09542 [Capronia epimyces CBS 606.96]|uniref:Cytochrome P450 oxidoreductase n=1 Tax=Capronia epimyces CBS 606.96 TaxID=1182542 RepID=W9XK21_9EURO|nr:uncharacterized protein A1O3_09542 [Capronia epimyces CBS 606.96]EXJ77316.1 hypothetical protein A1O3_09542 [Capronia epimyces CBS 606.96]